MSSGRMSVRVRKRNGEWWVFITLHGRRKAKSEEGDSVVDLSKQTKQNLKPKPVLNQEGLANPLLPHCPHSMSCGSRRPAGRCRPESPYFRA